MNINDPALKRIFNKITIDANGCWLWGTRTDGYGLVSWKGKPTSIHRLMYSWFVGPLEEGKVIRHACDVKNCCCPSHMLQGTHSENAYDCSRQPTYPEIDETLRELLVIHGKNR